MVFSLLTKPRRQTKKERAASVAEALVRFERYNPSPHCELYYETPLQLLISVVLSAQTTDKMVNRCMEPLYKDGLDLATLLSWGAEGLYPHVKSIGLAKTKSKHIGQLVRILHERFDGQVPNTRSELEALPGVGRKTASVVLGELFRQPTLAIDTHVFRVSKRLGWQGEKTPIAAERVLLQIIPPSYLPRAHHWLVLHGRYVCKAQKPLCNECPLNDICPSVGSKERKSSK